MGSRGSVPSLTARHLWGKDMYKTRYRPWSLPIRVNQIEIGPISETTGSNPIKYIQNFLVSARGKFLVESKTYSII